MSWVLSAFADEASESIDEQVRALTEAQMTHIDLRLVDGTNIVELPLDHAEQVKAKLDAAGIAVCMYGSPIGKIDIADDIDIDIARVRHLGELKKIFGAEAVRIFSYYNKEEVGEDQWQAASVERLRRLVEVADECGLVLYLENEIKIFGDNCRRVSILRDEVHRESPDRFKLIFDFDNFIQNGDDVMDAWTALRDDIEAIHLKEAKRQPDGSYQHVPSGTGDGRIPEILADCAQRGWDGPLTLEPHLARSQAVLATGPHGEANQSVADLSPYDCFQVAAKAARGLLADVNRL